MPDVNLNLPIIGQDDSTEEPKVLQALTDLQDAVNSLDVENLSTDAAATLGVGATGRGKSIIATEESRTNTAYGTLATPDSVTVTMPTDGLIFVACQAMWKESVSGGAKAAIFLGANQLKGASIQFGGLAPTPVVQAAEGVQATNTAGSPATNLYRYFSSSPIGLVRGTAGTSDLDYTGDVTTGQAVFSTTTSGGSGVAVIFAAAGSYAVSLQYAATSGSVTVKNRKLWVWTMGF